MTYVLANLVVGIPDLRQPSECPDCGFDAVVRFPIHALSEMGVSDMGTMSACTRCYDEAHRA